MYIPEKTATCCAERTTSNCPFSRGRYPCHDGCWCTKPDAVAIVLNGGWRMVEAKTLSHEDIVGMIDNPRKALHTVAYSFLRTGDTRRSGELCPGESVDVARGLVINAVVTDGA